LLTVLKNYFLKILFLLPFLATTALADPGIVWEEIVPDFEIANFSSSQGGLFSPSLRFARTSLKHLSVSVVRAKEFGQNRASAKEIVEMSGAYLAINASFFDPFGNPLGLILSRGISLNRLHAGGKVLTGIFLFDANKGPRILPRADFNSSGVVEAVQAGPRLLTQGEPIEGLKREEKASLRSGLCVDNKNRLILFSSSSPLGTIYLKDLQKILQDPLLGCIEALNLDGGGSAQLHIKVTDATGKVIFEESHVGRDEVPVFVVLKPRTP